MKKIVLTLATILLLFFVQPSSGQVYSNKIVGKKNAEQADSIRQSTYPYSLPLLGQQATSKGYTLPYSAGIGINYLWQQSDLIIDNLQVGFNNGTMYNLDNIIRFDKARSTATGINIRPDIWLFPFLNVYGILAKAKPSTEVGYGIYVPDSSGNWNQVLSLSSKAEFDATTFGFGLTPTIGVGGGWIALDMNFTWSDIEALEKPAFAFVLGPRFGKTFKLKRPEQNIAIWVGGFRLDLKSETSGSLSLSEVLPVEDLEAKLENANTKVDQSQQEVDAWWNNLSGVEQNNPVNKAKYETANSALATAGRILDAASGAVSTASTSTVQYSLEKAPKDKWNFIVGSQFQLNKNFMVRAEYGFLGSRQQLIAGLQYRFGL
jgi:hypothetical protein